MSRTLYVVTLYPYQDSGPAYYQFEDKAEAVQFASLVNAMDDEYLRGNEIAQVIETTTIDTAAEAIEELARDL